MSGFKNKSGVRPLEFKVVILPDAVDTKTSGGILLPDEAKDREQMAEVRGVLIEASPLAFTYADWPEGYPLPKPGDRIIVGRYTGVSFKSKIDDKDYRIVNDKDIIGVET